MIHRTKGISSREAALTLCGNEVCERNCVLRFIERQRAATILSPETVPRVLASIVFLGTAGDLCAQHVLLLLDLAARGDARVVLNGVIATEAVMFRLRVYISSPSITSRIPVRCMHARVRTQVHTHTHTCNTRDVAIAHTFPPYAPARVAGYVTRVSYETL